MLRWDNPQTRAAGVAASSTVSGWPFIDMAAVGNSSGQAVDFAEGVANIITSPKMHDIDVRIARPYRSEPIRSMENQLLAVQGFRVGVAAKSAKNKFLTN